MVTITTNKLEKCLPCPVTGGVSTRMTQQSFVAACNAHRGNRNINSWGHNATVRDVFHRRCNWCQGQRRHWPDELVLADVMINERKAMTTTVCDICGATANNKKNKSRGMTLCSSCKGIVPCVDRLDVVVAMMQRTGKAEELLNKLRPHDDDNSDLGDLEVVVRDARETLVKALPSGEALENAQSLYDIATIAEEVAWYIQEQQEKIENRAYQMEMENHRLKRENEYLVQKLDSRSPYDEALLEWARKRYEAGEIKLKVTVEEEADENN